MSTKNSPDFNFEKSLDELKQLVSKMEQGNLGLEQSLQSFESGVKLIRDAQVALDQAQQKVEVLTKEGKQTIAAFNADSDDD